VTSVPRASVTTAAVKLRGNNRGSASRPALFLWLGGLLAVFALGACTGDPEEGSEKDAVKGVVREAFAHPDRLCDELATPEFVETLGGEEKCLADSRPLVGSDRRREGGKGYVLAETRIEGDTAAVRIETPDFGRYDTSLVREGEDWRISAVDYKGTVPRTTNDP